MNVVLNKGENERHTKEVEWRLRGRERCACIPVEICIGMLFCVTVRHPLLSALPHSAGRTERRRRRRSHNWPKRGKDEKRPN